MGDAVAFYVVVTVAVVILGLSKGGFAGIGMISTPLVALLLGPVPAASLLLPILLIQDAVAVASYRATFDRPILLTLLPGAVIGIVLAYLFASRLPSSAVELALGIVSLTFSVRQLYRMRIGGATVSAVLPAHDRLLGVASGLAAGFTSTIAHAGTPPFQIYVMPKGLTRDAYVGTGVMFFAAVNLMKLPAFLALNDFALSSFTPSLAFIPLAIVSSWLGAKLVRRVDVAKFNLMVTLILVGVSIALIAQGAAGTLRSF